MTEKSATARKVRKGAWWAANILLPLSEARYVTTHIVPSLRNQLARTRALFPSVKESEKLPVLSFDDAVAASGMSVEALIRTYLRRKRLYLTLFYFPLVILCGLPVLALTAQITTPGLWARIAGMSLFLMTASLFMFMPALITSWRLWQLRNRRASPDEHGIFADFIAQPHWLRETLTFR